MEIVYKIKQEYRQQADNFHLTFGLKCMNVFSDGQFECG